MRLLIISFFILLSLDSSAQVSLDISGGISIYEQVNMIVDPEDGRIETLAYNPINARISYQVAPFSVGLSFSYYEFVNNFDNVYYFDEFIPEYLSYHMNGGMDRSMLSSMVSLSVDVYKEGVISVVSAIGVGNYLSNRAHQFSFRTVAEELFRYQTAELDGNLGFSTGWTAEIGIKVSTPKSWKLGAFIEAVYTANEMRFETTRLSRESLPLSEPFNLPVFSNNNIWIRGGLSFPLTSPSVNKEAPNP